MLLRSWRLTLEPVDRSFARMWRWIWRRFARPFFRRALMGWVGHAWQRVDTRYTHTNTQTQHAHTLTHTHTRVVLIMDIWHPDLTPCEVYVYVCLYTYIHINTHIYKYRSSS